MKYKILNINVDIRVACDLNLRFDLSNIYQIKNEMKYKVVVTVLV